MLFLRVVFFYFGVQQTKRKSYLTGGICVLDEKRSVDVCDPPSDFSFFIATA